jgi:Tol biopolymer transport system component
LQSFGGFGRIVKSFFLTIDSFIMVTHLSFRLLLALVSLGSFPGLAADEAEVDAVAEEARFLSEVRQLTFSGKRAGEGYFSADGKKMIFQSEREEDNPFYQIYLLDLETGDTTRVSPGTGKTTCAWLHPDGKQVLFASTHEDKASPEKQKQEFEERTSGKVRKYSWDYDENYDIFSGQLDGTGLQNLTRTRGYDAEGCFSPDGKSIVFASNRKAYERELTPEEAKRLETDKSWFMDLFIMKADGTGVTQLTDVAGYDGGPFFSADGKQICWRRFTEKGDQAEIYVMNVDGSNQRKVTDLGAMSWAPFFHPSGQYLIFGTNLHGFGNFELYLVPTKGDAKPVRVTWTDGFDSLPVFSPDGASLSWTSGRTSDKASQIFLAKWNHAAACEALGLSPEATAVSEKPDTTEKAPAPSEFTEAITEADIRKHVAWLASETLQGRLTGTEGEILAADYLAAQFEAAGLKPGGTNGSWFEEFDFTSGVSLGKDNRLSVTSAGGETAGELDKDWRPLSFSQTGEVPATEVVLAGYGIETPEGVAEAYSSYAHLDVKDKWVMLFRYAPEGWDKEKRSRMANFSLLRHKAMIARQKGAKGILVVSGPNSKVVDQLVPLAFDASLAGSGVAAISLSDAFASKLLEGTGKTLKEWQDAWDKGESMGGISLDGITLSAHVEINAEKKTGRNVVAVLPAGDAGNKQPAVLVGAHFDHLGNKAGSNSRAKDEEKGSIHYGADDNASGVAGLLEMAAFLSKETQEGRLKPVRDIVFAGWSGEEIGLLGSNAFARNRAKEAGDENASLEKQLAAYLNMDMIGRLRKSLVIQGMGSSPVWAGLVEKANVPSGLPLTTQNDSYLPTDSMTFYLRKVPVLNAFTGAHDEYHTPRDKPDTLNYEGATSITRFMTLVARDLAKAPDSPVYVEQARPKNAEMRGGLRVFLGTIPDYAQGDAEGVKLSGVSAAGPAAKAGVVAGDLIVELGGKEIKNIYDYTAVMAELKVGEKTTISVIRKGETVKLSITPGSRE